MMENEAKREATFEEEYEILKKEKEELFAMEVCDTEPPFANYVVRRALRCIRKLLEEVQQYRAIGTIEEFKALKEKSVAKKPDFTEDKQFALCPNISCNSKGLKDKQQYCPKCGQKLDWE